MLKLWLPSKNLQNTSIHCLIFLEVLWTIFSWDFFVLTLYQNIVVQKKLKNQVFRDSGYNGESGKDIATIPTIRKRWLGYEILTFPECIRELRTQGKIGADGGTETLIKIFQKCSDYPKHILWPKEFEFWGAQKGNHSKNKTQIQVKSWLHWLGPYTNNLSNKDVYPFPGISAIYAR